MMTEMLNLGIWLLFLYLQIMSSALGDFEDLEDIQLPGGQDNDPWSVRRERRPDDGDTSNYNNFMAASSDGVISGSELTSFVPVTPTPSHINCHVEIEVTKTERLGGECIRLGSSSIFRACRSGPYLDLFSRQCNTLLGSGASTRAAPINSNTDRSQSGKRDAGDSTAPEN